MTSKDWECPVCGSLMVTTSEGYITCPSSHGRLRSRTAVKDLPLAYKRGNRVWGITGREGFWEYVPHAHKSSLAQAPEPEHVVAMVSLYKGRVRRARTFRRRKAPGNRTSLR